MSILVVLTIYQLLFADQMQEDEVGLMWQSIKTHRILVAKVEGKYLNTWAYVG
jgi:hypothetical protein